MLWTLFHRLVVALTILAFVGGMTLQLMPPKAAFAAERAPSQSDCAHMAMPAQDAGSSHEMPCKGIDPECVKLMGCLGTPSLPSRLGADFVHVAYDRVFYWTPDTFRDGRSIKPDLFPPIGP